MDCEHRRGPGVVLISTYELGRQPFGLASPAAWLAREGARVACLDLAVQEFDEELVRTADLVAFYLPMHTATRLAAPLILRVRVLNPSAHICCFGLYAPMNEEYLHRLGATTILAGEFETALASLSRALRTRDERAPSTEDAFPKQQFLVPERRLLPPLGVYARLVLEDGTTKTVGYTEASRGCKHLCRHCPIVPVYGGRFRIVQPEIVLADIRQQVTSGAQHITFGDPDFFNGVTHAVKIVRALHEEFPDLTYDVTIKVEHLIMQARHLPVLRDTGYLFVTSAVETIDDGILEILDKGHTRADFVRAVSMLREVGIAFSPTFIPFTPWTSLAGYIELLAVLDELDLVEDVSFVQLAIRLLIPAGSRLLEGSELLPSLGAFDEEFLTYRWTHPDPRMDHLHSEVQRLVRLGESHGTPRAEIFEEVWQCAHGFAGCPAPRLQRPAHATRRSPHMTEPWYCCAEPTDDQFIRV